MKNYNKNKKFYAKQHKDSTPTHTDNNNQEIQLRHIRFDDFDIYSVLLPEQKEKLLFHKESGKTFIVAETFKFLGSKDNMWLCEDIHTKKIHIAPYNRFTQLDKKKDKEEVIPYSE